MEKIIKKNLLLTFVLSFFFSAPLQAQPKLLKTMGSLQREKILHTAFERSMGIYTVAQEKSREKWQQVSLMKNPEDKERRRKIAFEALGQQKIMQREAENQKDILDTLGNLEKIKKSVFRTTQDLS